MTININRFYFGDEHSKLPIVIITKSAVKIITKDIGLAKSFYLDGALVEYEGGKGAVFSELVKYETPPVPPVYPVWLNEHEKNILVAHWEKTGMFGSIIQKIRSTESLKGIK